MYLHFYERQRTNHIDHVVVFSPHNEHQEVMGFVYQCSVCLERDHELPPFLALNVPFQATVDRKVGE